MVGNNTNKDDIYYDAHFLSIYVATLSITSRRGNSVAGTITIHCQPVDYKSLTSLISGEAAYNANSTRRLIEIRENSTKLLLSLWEQGNLYLSLGSLVGKLDTFLKTVDRFSNVRYIITENKGGISDNRL